MTVSLEINSGETPQTFSESDTRVFVCPASGNMFHQRGPVRVINLINYDSHRTHVPHSRNPGENKCTGRSCQGSPGATMIIKLFVREIHPGKLVSTPTATVRNLDSLFPLTTIRTTIAVYQQLRTTQKENSEQNHGISERRRDDGDSDISTT